MALGCECRYYRYPWLVQNLMLGIGILCSQLWELILAFYAKIGFLAIDSDSGISLPLTGVLSSRSIKIDFSKSTSGPTKAPMSLLRHLVLG